MLSLHLTKNYKSANFLVTDVSHERLEESQSSASEHKYDKAQYIVY